MKKKKLSSLSLNKKTISNLNKSSIKGGGGNTYPNNCVITVTCGNSPCGFPHPGGTVGPGCTRDTRELSYCHGITIPDGCLSVHPCA